MQRYMTDRTHNETYCPFIGKRAVVIGAGIAGMTAAGALADWFEQVLVLEHDRLLSKPDHRPGTSQSWHAHGLLAGGQQAMETLFPGIGDDFGRAGAVWLRINQDFREERPNGEPMPQGDFGIGGFAMTRPLIEATLRRRVSQRANISFRDSTDVLDIQTSAGGQRVTAVRCASADGVAEIIPADLVVDASGRGQITGTLLQASGYARPRETTIGIDLCYTTAIVPIPDDAPRDWKFVLTHPGSSMSGRRSVMLPIEGKRWMMTVVGRGSDRPPAEWDALLLFLKGLNTPTIYNAVKRCQPTGKLARFLLVESVRRHFEELKAFPDGLLPIGDAICRFNPVYGQGMSVASKEAVLLHQLLQARAPLADPLAGLAQAFMAEAKEVIDTPWLMAAIPDFAHPETRGEPPADLDRSLQFSNAMFRIAVRDPSVQRLMIEVWHMLKPRSAYQDPELMQRVEEEMAVA